MRPIFRSGYSEPSRAKENNYFALGAIAEYPTRLRLALSSEKVGRRSRGCFWDALRIQKPLGAQKRFSALRFIIDHLPTLSPRWSI